MNRVYYIVGQVLKNICKGVTGGHGYCYDPEKPGKKKVQKDVPTTYGYYVGNEYQNDSANIEHYMSGRVSNDSIEVAFIQHLELILKRHIDENGHKLLIVTDMPKLTKAFISGKCSTEMDEEYFNKVHKLYADNQSSVIFDLTLYPKGGLGPKFAHNQSRMAEMILAIKPEGERLLKEVSEKEFTSPEVELNPIVTATRWYFNTGDKSKFYDHTDGKRSYWFGTVDKKVYHGKATPDVSYSILYTKKPLGLLDKLYDFCKGSIDNDLNLLFAGNLNNIKSKDVSRTIEDVPGVFKGNTLISPMTITGSDEPGLVDFLNPPGLAYRVVNFMERLDDIYKAFLNRHDTSIPKRIRFDDITDYFFVKEGGKTKIRTDFVVSTLKVVVPIISPDCPKPVKINLSVNYDTPGRNQFNSLIKDKIDDIKVYLMLNFNDPAGVSYCTITSTPDFDYVFSNSISNLRVYSLKELGR